MEQVTLKSRYGSTHFSRRARTIHPDSGKTYYQNALYEFTAENGFKAIVPKHVWDELRDEYFDRGTGIKYREAFQAL